MSRNSLAFFSFLLFISTAAASTLIYWPGKNSTRHSTALSACQSHNSTYVIRSTNPDGSVACGSSSQTFWTIRPQQEQCPFGDNGTQCNTSCDSPKVMQDGQCVVPACPLGQKPDSGGTCQPYVCEQTSSQPEEEKVYSDKQKKCTQSYNLDESEFCGFAGQKRWQTTNEQSVVTNDPNNVEQAYDKTYNCGFDVTKKDCTTRTDGTHYCKVTGEYNGQYNPDATNDNIYNCTTADCQVPPDKPQVDDPVPQNTSDNEPCNYVSVGGSLQCQSTQTTDNEGTKNCGTANGTWQCVPKAPTSNGIIIDSKVTTQSNPDGSTTTTKTDTATQTRCTDIGKCTTKTTTSTTTTTKDSNGNTTSVTGTCKGDNCPDANTNPDGNGDGFGDCVGDDCGDEGGNASPPTDAELGEVKTFGESTNEFLLRARSAPIVSALADIRAPSGGNCTEYQVDTYLGTLEYDSHCILIEEKRSLITLIVKTLWALLATWIVLG